ncbi:alpha-ketoglutarate-dependent dioxygenase alkB homolog 6 [Anopheles ziemanni]|uniref:alpha-ketoglutarate-dependent dioxygenase alkB homolog 6 n=1 Tax=Anopheles coustani TaxID=139045 RepID=UPI00265B3520|nr:alpha-ketoglutarate-dependent dioxygenase alkB homolog 6 [Anopheles coustani]XP_058174991.1 alpha-ketoglutarate-dependent dioxygenase alkB homolog 6 [Anopheles ziemanni]
MNWKEHEVPNCPASVYYVPNFISEEDEASILQSISKTPKPRWTQLSNRRLINYGGIPHPKGMIAEDMPVWLTQYVQRINQLNVFDQGINANHVLVNEYLPGQGIMPHLDGPLFYPVIATISCGSHTVLEYDRQLETGPADNTSLVRESVAKMLLEPRSLLVVKDDMYHTYFHSIKELEQDVVDSTITNLSLLCKAKLNDVLLRGTRISLTIRHVPKTTKMKIKIF